EGNRREYIDKLEEMITCDNTTESECFNDVIFRMKTTERTKNKSRRLDIFEDNNDGSEDDENISNSNSKMSKGLNVVNDDNSPTFNYNKSRRLDIFENSSTPNFNSISTTNEYFQLKNDHDIIIKRLERIENLLFTANQFVRRFQ
ncbi:hypothetical protein SNEBB_004200, partial [Seison nebaliae]